MRTAEIVAAEIRAYTASMLNDAVEIGRRMVEAKELVPYGEFESWVERETGYSSSSASNFMRLYTEYGDPQGSLFGASLADPQTYGKLTKSKLLLLLSVPREERAEFVREAHAEELSVRELQAAIRERDEAKRAQAEAEMELEASEKLRAELADEFAGTKAEIEAARRKIAELEARPVEVAVQEPDPDAIERRAAELANKAIEAKSAEAEAQTAALRAEKAEAEKKLKEARDKARAEREKLQAKLKEAEEKAAEAGKQDTGDAARYKAEAEELRKKLALSGEETVVFKLRFAAWQEAYAAMEAALDKLPEEQREKCRAAVKAQAERWAGQWGTISN